MDITVYNTKWFLDKIKEVRPNDYMEYKFLGPYTKSREPIKAIHLVCGSEIEIIPNTFISCGSSCKYCSAKEAHRKQRKSQSSFNSELPSGVICMESYKGAFIDIMVHCFFCDSTYKVKPHNLLRHGCTHCSGRNHKTLDEIKTEVKIITDDKYEVLSDEFHSVHEHILVNHKECSNPSYLVTMHNFLHNGRRCPYCNEYKGEVTIRTILNNLGIDFEPQKKFPNLTDIRHLSYDFYISKYKLLIEYQGEQHYNPMRYSGGKDKFKIQQYHDKLKRNYAKNNGYKLLEIPYKITSYEGIKEKILSYIK